MKKTICLRHYVKPDHRLMIDGCGDCTICVPDKKNKECRCYYPITIVIIEECKCD